MNDSMSSIQQESNLIEQPRSIRSPGGNSEQVQNVPQASVCILTFRLVYFGWDDVFVPQLGGYCDREADSRLFRQVRDIDEYLILQGLSSGVRMNDVCIAPIQFNRLPYLPNAQGKVLNSRRARVW